MVHSLRRSLQVLSLMAAAWMLPCVAYADGAPFKEMREYLGDLRNGSQDRWFATLSQLAKSFDDVCGDTFCEGDYSDLSALSTYCSVSSDGIVNQCVWLFAGSYSSVSTKNGALGLKRRIFTCKLPLARGTTAQALIDALAVPGIGDPIQRPLPGTSTSIYYALAICLR